MAVKPPRPIFERLRADIVDGEFGWGNTLEIKPLEEKYNVSSIPLREALIALATEDLVDFVPKRGFETKKPDLIEISNHLALMEMLLVESAYYVAANDNRRRRLRSIVNTHLPLRAEAFVSLSPFLAARAFVGVITDASRIPHSEAFQRSLFRTAAILHQEFHAQADMRTVYSDVRAFFRSISDDLPEIAEWGVKKFFNGVRGRLADTMSVLH